MPADRLPMNLVLLACLLVAGGCSESESSEEGGTDSTTSSTSSTTADTGEPVAGGMYEDCGNGYLCEDGLVCQQNFGGEGPLRWCTIACDPAGDSSDCPANPDGSEAAPTCIEADADAPTCWLDCFGDLSCPAGMTCRYNSCGWAYELP